jgi:hypothetical protein
MTEYVGCEQARELLEGLIDGELSMNEQLAVESHLRWCRTCALRVEDLRLIGGSLRLGSIAPDADADHAVNAINDAVLMRVRAERDQSWPVRARDTFSDMRLLFPAVGATAAVAVCLVAAASVLHATSVGREESLASMITTLSNPAPIRPAENGFFGISIPRPNEDDAVRAGGTLDALPEEDLIYTVRTVVDRRGRVTNFELLLAGGGTAERSATHAGHNRAVLDAIAQTRFGAAPSAFGQPVAFDMVWVIAKTTAVAGPVAEPVPARPAAVKTAAPKLPVEPPIPAELPRPSTTARPLSSLDRSATA